MQYVTSWSTFYTVVAEASATLTGLMFIVITLLSQKDAAGSEDGIATFGTPNVLNFCSALFASLVMIAPLHSVLEIALLVGCSGVYGFAHVVGVVLRTRRLTTNKPDDVEDWTIYIALPLAAYAIIAGSAIALPFAPAAGLDGLSAGVTLLVFIGIRNAWDSVTFIVLGGADKRE